MNTMHEIESWASELSLSDVAPWMAAYAGVCVLWAVSFDPLQSSVVLAFAPLWAGWHR